MFLIPYFKSGGVLLYFADNWMSINGNPSLHNRLQLATLYVQMGQADDALMVLESDPNSEKVDEKAMSSEMDLFTMTSQDEAVEESTQEALTKVNKSL